MARELFERLVMLSMICSFTLSIEMSKFGTVKGYIEQQPGKSFFATMWKPSGMDCAFWCYQQKADMCSMAQYFPTNGYCQLFYWKDVRIVRLLHNSNDSPYDLYIGPDPKHMYLGSMEGLYVFTFEEGKMYCGLVGGRLGHSQDLVTSRDSGWEICACGWLNDGFAYFLVSTPSASCGTSNIWQCSHNPTFGVHCLID